MIHIYIFFLSYLHIVPFLNNLSITFYSYLADEIAKAIIEQIVLCGLKDYIGAISFDTTAMNIGSVKGKL